MSTRSIAPSKSSCRMYCWSLRAAKMAASFAMFARSAPVRPAVRRARTVMSTSAPSGFERVCTREDLLAAVQVRRGDVDLAVEAPGAQQGRDRGPGAGWRRP